MNCRPVDTHIDALGMMNLAAAESMSMTIADAIAVAYPRRRIHACSLVAWFLDASKYSSSE
jgi:hypothetical protein